MRLFEVLDKKYDKDHVCKTPGAIYSTEFHGRNITINIKLPKDIEIPDEDLDDLEVAGHYALEKVLAKYFD